MAQTSNPSLKASAMIRVLHVIDHLDLGGAQTALLGMFGIAIHPPLMWKWPSCMARNRSRKPSKR